MDPNDTQAVGSEAPETPVEDTAATQPSEASESETQAPEATQEQTEVESQGETEVKAEDTAEEKLLAGKYKSVEDLEKSYKELESKYGKEASEKAELTRILNDAFAPEPAAPAATDTDDDIYAEPAGNNDTDVLKRDMAVMKFILAHEDADGSTMKEVLASDPLISQISGHEAKLEYAYLRSKNMTQPKAIEEARKSAAQQTHAKIAEKQVAQVESAKKAEPIDDNAELMTQATTGKPKERESARLSLIRKHLTQL